jgi:hypothetical protein
MPKNFLVDFNLRIMGSVYQIQIVSEDWQYEILDSIFGTSNLDKTVFWNYPIEENDANYINGLSYLVSLLEAKLLDVIKLGIKPVDISIWYLYEYDQQCNMEFDASELKRMGDLGVTLCISCWQKE